MRGNGATRDGRCEPGERPGSNQTDRTADCREPREIESDRHGYQAERCQVTDAVQLQQF